MQLCPNCQADITGLLYRCDCCGQPIRQKPSLFIWQTFEVSECGDLTQFVREVFESLNKINTEQIPCSLQKVRFDIFCYPEEMVTSLKLIPSIRYSKKHQAITTRILIDYNTYINSDKTAKRKLIIQAFLRNMDTMRHKMMHLHIPLEELWAETESYLCSLQD